MLNLSIYRRKTIQGYCDVDPLYIPKEELMQFDTKCNVGSLKLYYSWRGHRLVHNSRVL